MAFDSKNLALNSSGHADVPRIFGYKTEDNVATVTAVSYFDGAIDVLRTGDQITIQGTAGPVYVATFNITNTGTTIELTATQNGGVWEKTFGIGDFVLVPGTDQPTLIVNGSSSIDYSFADNAVNDEEIYTSYRVPPNYESNTDLAVEIRYSGSNDPSSGVVVWGIDIVTGGDGDPENSGDVTTLIPVTIAANDELFRSVISTIDGGTIFPGQALKLRFYRNSTAAGDTYTGQGRLSHIHINAAII